MGVLVLYMIHRSYSYFPTHEIYVLCGWLEEHLQLRERTLIIVQAEKAGKFDLPLEFLDSGGWMIDSLAA